MYKNKAADGKNNFSGSRIRKFRNELKEAPSQRQFAEMLQIAGLDMDKNAVQRIESGERFVTDIEIKVIAQVLNVSFDDLLADE
jgi:transcriptional regulator with XRE-family HTH domain